MRSLKSLLDKGALRPFPASASETADLFRVVDRDLADARVTGLSADRRFATAYNAALQLATIVLRSEGYRTFGAGHHYTTILALRAIMGEDSTQRRTTWMHVVPAETRSTTMVLASRPSRMSQISSKRPSCFEISFFGG